MEDQGINKTLDQKITEFYKKNRRKFYLIFGLILIVFLGLILISNLQENKNQNVSDDFNRANILIANEEFENAKKLLFTVIENKDKFYSPLALNTIIEQGLYNTPLEIIEMYDTVINIRGLEEENKELIKFKKALFLLNSENEGEMIKVMKSIIENDSVWKLKATNFLIEFYTSKKNIKEANNYKKLLNK